MLNRDTTSDMNGKATTVAKEDVDEGLTAAVDGDVIADVDKNATVTDSLPGPDNPKLLFQVLLPQSKGSNQNALVTSFEIASPHRLASRLLLSQPAHQTQLARLPESPCLNHPIQNVLSKSACQSQLAQLHQESTYRSQPALTTLTQR